MKYMKKILSSVLVLAMLLSSLMTLVLSVSAEEENTYIYNIQTGQHTAQLNAALKNNYLTAQDKLDNEVAAGRMSIVARLGDLTMYVSPYLGEVYVKNEVTGQILGTNPYNIGGVSLSNATIADPLLSQFVLNFNRLDDLDTAGTSYNSYAQSAKRGQITVTPVKNGVRISYVAGDTAKRYAVPYGIMKDRFIEEFVIPMQKRLAEDLFLLARSVIGGTEQYNNNLDKFSYETQGTWGDIKAFGTWFDSLNNWYYSLYKNDKLIDMTAALEFGNLSKPYFGLMSVYNEKDPNTAKGTILQDMLDTYPILRETNPDGTYANAIFVLDEGLPNNKLREQEATIMDYVNGYSITTMYEDEEATGVKGPDVTNPIFHLALEYVLTEDGMQVTLPADSLVYDESLYVINYVDLLPYLGTGKVAEGGYLFYPDGSGTIVEFADFASSTVSFSASVYGIDHAYYNITGQHAESIALPVFGTVDEEYTYSFEDPYEAGRRVYCTKEQYESGYVFTYRNTGTASKPVFTTTYPNGTTREVTAYFMGGNSRPLSVDNVATAKTTITPDKMSTSHFTNASFSIMEEGEAMASFIASLTPNANNPYSSLYARLSPMSKDKYNLKDTMGAFANSTENTNFTVFSDNKYVGNFTTRVIMLTGSDANYSGMARAYRAYLMDAGVLTTLADIEENLPLYIESFGVIETTKKFLSIPFEVDVALTTFDDVETMYTELKDMGITNIKFRLTGFANGGMYSTYPATLKWESKVGGKSGYKDLLAFVDEYSELGLEVFPNFNFSYIENTGSFDGVSLKKDGARSLDNRYSIRKTYSSVYQMFTRVGGVVVSTDRLEALFAKFHKKNAKFDNSSLSLDYIGSELSSNFSEKNTINREDSLDNVEQFLTAVQNAGYSSLMTVGGNAYALRYMSNLLKAPIDSSHYTVTSYTVPFWGMVMHGSIQYAGGAFNEEANKSDALLKAIESGANLYFTLSYLNTQLLKDDELLSDYYSVNYEISKETVKKYYNILNAAIGDLQNFQITHHHVISSERVIEEAEILSNRLKMEAEFVEQLEAYVKSAVVRKQAMIAELTALANTLRDSDNNLITAYKDMTTLQRNAALVFLEKYEFVDADIAAAVGTYTTDAARVNNLLAKMADGTLVWGGDATIDIHFDRDLVLQEAVRQLCVEKVADLSDTFISDIDLQIASLEKSGTWHLDTDNFTFESKYQYVTSSEALDGDYDRTNYTVDNGSVTMVVYSNGTQTVRFILNHNGYSVNIKLDGKTYTLGKYAFERLDP